ncbi:hypothetical protein GQ53DRAFT_840109 [Thozetella sp. PMI_491]|nr:hypothetical protein GQ53DRAFT_840109 [Thozetella sp. PMI_491]
MGDRGGRPSRQTRGDSREDAANDETRPLLMRRAFSHEFSGEPVFSCATSLHSHLPVYTNIHRIRRDIVAVVEDYLSLDQLRDVRINVSVVRPLVDKLYDLDDISIVYCLLVNRAQFLEEQANLRNRQNVYFTRAALCELIATRILRRFNEDNEGPEGLLVLAHILVAGFSPFQNAPEEIRREAHATNSWHSTLPALEVAIISESKLFLSSTSCTKVVDAIYDGRVIYTPSSFIDIIPDRYKQKPISLYDPREASLLNQYRLIVPRTRNYLEIFQFVILLLLYLAFMAERDAKQLSILEICFTVFAFGWALDQFATILEHGWNVYSQNLWSFLDVTFVAIYWIYLILRIHGFRVGDIGPGQQALDVLAMGAPVLIPRLAFNLLSNNLLFVSLRSMMVDFTLLTALAAWCFFGFLLSLLWLGEGAHPALTISKWMVYIWFGLDGSGIQRSAEFHWLLGPTLMVTFAFLGNTLFLTILVSMLSNTFSTIVSNATAEIQYRRAVLTLEGVKSDAIFAYQPPFNILALVVLVPLKFFVSARWFHKIHVASVRLVNLPILLLIAVAERRLLWPGASPLDVVESTRPARRKPRFWDNWRITVHSDIGAVFDLPPPDAVVEQISADDHLTANLIRRQYTRHNTADGGQLPTLRHFRQNQQRTEHQGKDGAGQRVEPKQKAPSRRDSIVPFPGLRAELRGLLNESDEVTAISSRLEALEETTARIEELLTRLAGRDSDDIAVEEMEEQEDGDVERTGTLGDLDRTADNR